MQAAAFYLVTARADDDEADRSHLKDFVRVPRMEPIVDTGHGRAKSNDGIAPCHCSERLLDGAKLPFEREQHGDERSHEQARRADLHDS